MAWPAISWSQGQALLLGHLQPFSAISRQLHSTKLSCVLAHSCLSRIMALGASTEGELIHSKRTATPSAKVTSADNVANHELSSHRQAQAQATLHTTAGSKRKGPPSTLSDSSDELEDVSISSSKRIHKGMYRSQCFYEYFIDITNFQIQ